MKIFIAIVLIMSCAGCVMIPTDFETYNRVDPHPRYILPPPPPPPIIIYGPRPWYHQYHRLYY